MSKTKYMLVDRGPSYPPTAVSQAVLDDMLKTPGLVLGHAPITKAKLKADRVHIYEDSWYFEHKAWDAFKATWHGVKCQGRVAWFDNVRGLGMVEFGDGQCQPIYACNIKGRKTWYPETACVYYTKGQLVDIDIEVTGRQAFVKGLTQGTEDTEGWDRIKDQPLAFRCDSEGNAVNGLFSHGA